MPGGGLGEAVVVTVAAAVAVVFAVIAVVAPGFGPSPST